MSFLREYIKNPKEIGSITADSSRCVDIMLDAVDFRRANVLIEYGSGTGAVTREILQRMNTHARLLSFEKNPGLFRATLAGLNSRQLCAFNRDIFTCSGVFQDLGLDGHFADCIISTLPCSTIDCHKLIEYHVLPYLQADAVFIQYMHMLSVIKGFRLLPILNRYFGLVKRKAVWRNLPPAFVYICRL